MDKKTLYRLARLARIKIDTNQEQKLLQQMEWIVAWVGKIQQYPLDDEKQLRQPVKKQMEVQEGVQDFEDPDVFLANVKHKIKDRQIVIKSPIK